MPRARLGSRLGFILLSAGCAIGIGNVWRFPYMAGQNGGAIFVVIYLICLAALGIPAMTMEFAMGRAAQKSIVKLYDKIEPPKSKWHIHGKVCFAGNIILMMFYTTVAGWMLYYFVKMIKGDFDGATSEAVAGQFSDMLAQPGPMILFVGIVVALGFFVCAGGVAERLEVVTKWMMLALMAIMVILVINSFRMEGAAEGLKFFLVPSVDKVKEVGLAQVILGALNQSFFTLSIGMGSMAIFGSYIGKQRRLFGESLNVAVLDTIIAIASGLIIFPTCFSYNVEVTAGPSLIFVTLPNIFANMPGGRVWGALFFLFMSFAALSTVFAVFENIISCTLDTTKLTRRKACIIDGALMFALSLPCVLGFNVWSKFQPFAEGSGIMDLEDFVVSNLILPIGCIVFIIFCTSKYGWGWKNFLAEANEGKGLKIAKWLRPYMAYVMPVIIAIVLIVGLINFNYS